MQAAMGAVPGLVECGALIAIGYNLRASGLFRTGDGETALRLATYLTIPAVILRTLSSQAVSVSTWLAVAVGAICVATQAASNWLSCTAKPKRERAVIAGSATGSSLHLLAYPMVEAVFGPTGLQTVVLMDAVNQVAGPAFPEQYKHEDGGTYRGQWRGMRKEGLGVYVYPSGAKYEGEWRDNLKDGRGVYYYPKGGTYEGEWSNGVMNGVGVRTFGSGQVKAGRWRDGQLESPLELWQCASAAEGAAESALAARRVDVGGGKPEDALRNLVLQAPLWACLAGLAASLLGVPPLSQLAPSLDAVTAALARANRPLLLLAAGMALRFEVPQPLMVRDVAHVLSTRLLVPLFIGGVLLLVGSSGASPQDLTPLVVVLVSLLAPVAPTAQQFARTFRLSEALASAIVCTSNIVCIPAMACACVAAGAAGLLPPGASGAVATVSAAAGSVASEALLLSSQPAPALTLACFCLGSALLVKGLATLISKRYGDELQVRMVYRGSSPAQTDASQERGLDGAGGSASPSAISATHQRQQQTRHQGTRSFPFGRSTIALRPGPLGGMPCLPPMRCLLTHAHRRRTTLLAGRGVLPLV